MDKGLILATLMLLTASINVDAQDTLQFVDDVKPLIVVQINGRQYSMLVDTGASVNIVSREVASSEKMRVRTVYAGNIYSVVDKITARHVDKADISVSGRHIHQFVMMDIEGISETILLSTGIKISGILGVPAIRELGMIIDLKRGIITLKD